MTREELLDNILEAYASCYDIERFQDGDSPLAATADFHEHQSGFMLIRKAEMWSADRHEYSFFYSIPRLTKKGFDSCMQKTMELGMPKIKPVPGHMVSNLVAVFLCDDADEDAITALKKYKYRKSFRFSFNGWMETHTAAAVLNQDILASNAAGRNAARFLDIMLHPEKRRKKKNGIIELLIKSAD